MSKKAPPPPNLNELLEKFYDHAATDPDARLSAPTLATRFIDTRKRKWPKLPPDLRHAAYLGIVQAFRMLLRNRNPHPGDIDPMQMTFMPEDKLLLERYSVPSKGVDDDRTYVPRHMLTEAEMLRVVDAYLKASAYFTRAADALRSWWYRTHTPGGDPTGEKLSA